MEVRTDRFHRLIEPLHDRVLSFARCLCRSSSDGDDLFQDAMARAFAKLDSLRDDGAFRTWLFRVVLTVHRSRCRRAFWRRLIPLDADDGSSDRPEHDYRSEGWSPALVEANLRARTALAQLDPVVREAIVLFEIEGWLVDEIASLQRASVSAIKSRLARGRTRLRALYDAQPTLDSLLTQGEH